MTALDTAAPTDGALAGTRPGRRALVLQHHPLEHPGALAPHLAAAGFALTAVELDAGDHLPALEPFDLLIAMGGPMDVWEEDAHPWLVDEKAAIRHWVTDLGRPFLGVCLGHQLLADALGGEVGARADPEVGVVDLALTGAGVADRLVGALGSPFPGLQWHGAEVRRPPADAAVLARNGACAVQAIHVPPAAWGLQFHVEVDGRTVDEWSTVPAYRAALAAVRPDGVAWLRQAVEGQRVALAAVCEALAGRLVAVCSGA